MRMTKWIIVGGLLWASLSHAVSRVGGGSVFSVEDGYRTKLPVPFQKHIRLLSGVRLEGPILFQSQVGGVARPFPQVIQVLSFSETYPALASLARTDLANALVARGWTRMELTEPCAEAWMTESSNARTIAMTWGDGKGVVFAGTKTGDALDGLEEMIDELKLEPGACAWK